MKNVLIFVPAYNCEKQIGRVIDQLEQSWIMNSNAKVIIVDNNSTDDTVKVVLNRIHERNDKYIELIINDSNYGLGGSHKVAFQYASIHKYEWIIVLHGDDQGSIVDLKGEILALSQSNADCILGSRFMRGAFINGYSRFRIFGNIIFNLIYSICLRSVVFDLGSGLNIYRVSKLRGEQYLRFPDGLTFNCVMLCSNIINQDKVNFVPISWREDDQVSNVRLIRQSIHTLKIAIGALFYRSKFLSIEHRQVVIPKYTWRVIDA